MGLLAPAALGQCAQRWSPQFAAPYGASDQVRTIITFDDGTGPAMYVGGLFTQIGGVAANGIARYDEPTGTFTPLGAGVNGSIFAMAVYQGRLYVAGQFTNAGGLPAGGVAFWDGSHWFGIGTLSGATAAGLALCVSNTGPTPGLILGGNFTTVSGVSCDHIARWDGSSWSPMGSGFAKPILSLATFTDAGGAALYAGGLFSSLGGVTAHLSLARWDGQQWSLVTGPEPVNGNVYSLATYDDGSGASLYLGGGVSYAFNGQSCYGVARWDGAHFHNLGNGVTAGAGVPIQSFAVFDDGSGSALYMGGTFTSINNVPAQNIARWNGTTCSAVNDGVTSSSATAVVYALGANPIGQHLFLGGVFDAAQGVSSSNIASWERPDAVVIDAQPVNASGAAGGSVVLSVAARGEGVLGYQWRHNGLPISNTVRISGAGGPVLQINNVAASDAGAYDCDVSNACGTLRSSPAGLSVAACTGDVNGDLRVDLSDLAAVLAVYGSMCD